ncbi:hypothetical protein HDU82_002770 [Entophlyctis luteolus]|nr:hypothetical protein HDU82_002770 [Entophlyctis luteolus]
MATPQHDLEDSYIALLEERVAMTQDLNKSYAVLRDMLDKLAASEADVTKLKLQVANLTTQLKPGPPAPEDPDGASVTPAAIVAGSSGSDSFQSNASFAAGEATSRTGQSMFFDADHGPNDASTVPQKRPRTTEEGPVVDYSGLSSDSKHRTHSAGRDSHVQFASGVTASAAALATPTTQMTGADIPRIDMFVIKTGSGPSRVIRCSFCRNEILSKHRPRWERHVSNCASAPKSVQALFSGVDNLTSAAPFAEVSPPASFTPPTTASHAANFSLTQMSNMDLGELINFHVEKNGIGAKRVITCIYCRSSIESYHKKKWQQHVATCEHAPEAVQQLFVSALPPPRANAMELTASGYMAQAQDAGDGVITEHNHYVPPTNARAEHGVLAPFPCPPEPTLPSGQANTEGWRAWTDIIRYQRPDVVIEAKTGINVTKFKRLHGLAEIRMYPRTSARRTHSNMCSAIPERLVREFLAFMDPTFDIGDMATTNGTDYSSNAGKIESSYGGGFIQKTDPSGNGHIPTESDSGSAQKTKYTDIVRRIVPKYKTLPEESRKAVKRGVKKYLESVFKDAFSSECVQVTDKGTTYVIPHDAIEDFTIWAAAELGRQYVPRDDWWSIGLGETPENSFSAWLELHGDGLADSPMSTASVSSNLAISTYCVDTAGTFCVRAVRDGSAGTTTFTLTSETVNGWIAIGTGTQMAGSRMYVGWGANATTAIVSQRDGGKVGHSIPQYVATVPGARRIDIAVASGGSIQAPAALGVEFGVDISDGVVSTTELSRFIYAVSDTAPTAPSDAAGTFAEHPVYNCGAFVLNVTVLGTETVGVGIGTDRSRVAHGALMFTAWAVLLPVGIFIARYLKDRLGAGWYVLHKWIMIAGVSICTVAGLVIIELSVPTGSSRFSGSQHAILGAIITLALYPLQIILGLVSNALFDPSRPSIPWWDQVHWWIGRLLLLLGILNTFFGLILFDPPAFYTICYWIWIGIVACVFAFLGEHFLRGAVYHMNGTFNRKEQENPSVTELVAFVSSE